ncbi:MAG: hypothetical protein V1861_00995 [Candidatus Micrarchaeota archaeon]
MADSFTDFMARFFKAIEGEDAVFLKAVYLDWFESSGVMKGGRFGDFLAAAMPDLKGMAGSRLAGEECFDDFCIAYLKGADGSEFSLTFRKKDDSYIFFNERSGFAGFKKVYALGYALEGGRLRILFNGKRAPIVHEIESSGAVSFINSALKLGANEITLEPVVAGERINATIRISSGAEGGVMNSAQGDVLSWDGEVSKPVILKFDAE